MVVMGILIFVLLSMTGFSFVVLSPMFIHRGNPESRDSEDRMEEALKRIEKRLEQLAPQKS